MEMKFLAYFVFLSIDLILKQSEAVELDCHIKAKSNINLKFWKHDEQKFTKILCEEMGYIYHENPAKSYEWTEKNEFDLCVGAFLQYFKEIKVEQTDVENFGKYCKKHKLNYEKSKKLVDNLKPFCWNLSDISKLPVVFQNDGGDVKITPNDWEKFQYDNMQLHLCLTEIGSAKSDDKIKQNKISILENYKKMFGEISKCTCVEVIGLENIYNKLNKNGEYDSLKSFYDDVCVKGLKREKSITKEQLEAISNYDIFSSEAKSLGVNLKKIVKFINTGERIFSNGWHNKNMKSSNWPLSDILKNAEVNNEFNLEIINVMAEAILHRYSSENYNEFIKITNDSKLNHDLKTWKCRQEIFSAFNLDSDKQSLKFYVSWKYKTAESAEKAPNILLQLLLDLNPPSTTCTDFLKSVRKITNSFYNSRLPADEVYELLKLAKTSNKNLGEVFDCLTLVNDLEKEFEKNGTNLISKPKDADDAQYDRYQTLAVKAFNKKLFENHNDGSVCKSQIFEYQPAKNKAQILKLFRTLFEVDTQISNLDEIFVMKKK